MGLNDLQTSFHPAGLELQNDLQTSFRPARLELQKRLANLVPPRRVRTPKRLANLVPPRRVRTPKTTCKPRSAPQGLKRRLGIDGSLRSHVTQHRSHVTQNIRLGSSPNPTSKLVSGG